MRFASVTLGHEEVEWITPEGELKDAIWNDTAFADWFAEREPLEALEAVTLLHRQIANQLASRGGTRGDSNWAGRAISLTIRLKRRRQEIRHALRVVLGEDEVLRLISDFDARHPRAPFLLEGSGSTPALPSTLHPTLSQSEKDTK